MSGSVEVFKVTKLSYKAFKKKKKSLSIKLSIIFDLQIFRHMKHNVLVVPPKRSTSRNAEE